ncbi:MAG: hypothetical protein LBT62_00285 [Deltaproteobacteria bacterium]|jgi:hypothetical protein|nr:hypothetical protein [Deltaproteobacteria bacterium]
MDESTDVPSDLFSDAFFRLNSQAAAHRVLMQSQSVLLYGEIVKNALGIIKIVIADGDFETLLKTEMAIQKLEEEKYAHDESMVKIIKKTQLDLAVGIRDCRQLVDHPES